MQPSSLEATGDPFSASSDAAAFLPFDCRHVLSAHVHQNSPRTMLGGVVERSFRVANGATWTEHLKAGLDVTQTHR